MWLTTKLLHKVLVHDWNRKRKSKGGTPFFHLFPSFQWTNSYVCRSGILLQAITHSCLQTCLNNRVKFIAHLSAWEVQSISMLLSSNQHRNARTHSLTVMLLSWDYIDHAPSITSIYVHAGPPVQPSAQHLRKLCVCLSVTCDQIIWKWEVKTAESWALEEHVCFQ